jgi:hypothetical protein
VHIACRLVPLLLFVDVDEYAVVAAVVASLPMQLVSRRDYFCRLIKADLSGAAADANIYKQVPCECIYSIEKIPKQKITF